MNKTPYPQLNIVPYWPEGQYAIVGTGEAINPALYTNKVVAGTLPLYLTGTYIEDSSCESIGKAIQPLTQSDVIVYNSLREYYNSLSNKE